MIATDEIRKNHGQLQFSLAALGQPGLRTRAQALKLETTIDRDVNRYELNLSGERVLAGFAAAAGFIGVFMWALIRLWLFEA